MDTTNNYPENNSDHELSELGYIFLSDNSDVTLSDSHSQDSYDSISSDFNSSNKFNPNNFLKKIHKCEFEYCSHIFKRFGNKYKSVSNPDYNEETGRCKKYGILENNFIIISNYLKGVDIDNIIDENVTSDNKIKIEFSYPLSKNITFEFESKTGRGFTSLEIIDIICRKYEEIYRVEEETAPVNEYFFQSECKECNDSVIDFSDIIIYDPEKIQDSECSICMENYDEKSSVIKIPCNHMYHEKCILQWFENNKTCPLCRNHNSTLCTKCDGGVIDRVYIGKVLPLDLRVKMNGGLLNRNSTQGIYGIWGHDLSDLAIEILNYDPETKQVRMFIGS